MKYEVEVSSSIYGTDVHVYDTQEEAEAGLERLKKAADELADNVWRSYTVRSVEDEDASAEQTIPCGWDSTDTPAPSGASEKRASAPLTLENVLSWADAEKLLEAHRIQFHNNHHAVWAKIYRIGAYVKEQGEAEMKAYFSEEVAG